ncbi:hypothetical protein CHS0354_018488 [Potamilus streckersoni]|uniref:Uncharacterized protein n=1 Tax=Potamilus streckersoni TaxID=2493646 RepID=A0AAE0TBU5_9BIVA|nr:hypothetical protein CHS0354_018488 [Potamilus streckersoni]
MSGDKSQDILRLYFAEKNRTAFEANGFHVYDSDTVAAKYAAGNRNTFPLKQITACRAVITETPDRIYTLKTNDARMDEEYSQLLLKAGKVIKADFKLPETFILYETPDTKDWLTRRYNRLFRPQTTSPPYKKAPPADGTYDPDYYIEYIRAETEDIMRNEKHEPLKNNRLDKLEKLAVILFGKYSEHAGIIAACAELAVLHKKRYQTAENFARKGLKANPLHSKLYLFLIMSAGTGSGEGKRHTAI